MLQHFNTALKKYTTLYCVTFNKLRLPS